MAREDEGRSGGGHQHHGSAHIPPTEQRYDGVKGSISFGVAFKGYFGGNNGFGLGVGVEGDGDGSERD